MGFQQTMSLKLSTSGTLLNSAIRDLKGRSRVFGQGIPYDNKKTLTAVEDYNELKPVFNNNQLQWFNERLIQLSYLHYFVPRKGLPLMAY